MYLKKYKNKYKMLSIWNKKQPRMGNQLQHVLAFFKDKGNLLKNI